MFADSRCLRTQTPVPIHTEPRDRPGSKLRPQRLHGCKSRPPGPPRCVCTWSCPPPPSWALACCHLTPSTCLRAVCTPGVECAALGEYTDIGGPPQLPASLELAPDLVACPGLHHCVYVYQSPPSLWGYLPPAPTAKCVHWPQAPPVAALVPSYRAWGRC